MSELKNQELPPLDITPEESERCGQYATVVCRERQLSAALNELKAKDDKLQEWASQINAQTDKEIELLGTIEKRDTELAAKDAKIAGLAGNIAKRKAAGETTTRLFLQLQDRAEAAEKSLGAVSEVLEDYERVRINHIQFVARLRSIVEGK